MANFYHVYLKRNSRVADDEIKEKMDKALDWYRVNPSLYIVYSNVTAEKLYTRLSPLAKEDGFIFICEFNLTNRQGWMPSSFWKWVKKDRSEE